MVPVAAYLLACACASPANHTEEDFLLELRKKYLAMGPLMCGLFDFHLFDTKKLV